MRVSGDAFLRPSESGVRGGRDSAEGYYEDSFDHAAFRASIMEADGLVLADGVFLFREELDDLWSFRVFVEISEEESLRRGARKTAYCTRRAKLPSISTGPGIYRRNGCTRRTSGLATAPTSWSSTRIRRSRD